MVDALREAHRVLVPTGVLLDLRPTAETCPLQLAETGLHVGELDATASAGDDAAADSAMAHVVRDGWFDLTVTNQFSLEFRWNGIAELADYVSGGRYPKRVRPGCDDLTRVYGSQVPLRCERTMTLGAYRKSVRRARERS
jgi:hypothetical protein